MTATATARSRLRRALAPLERLKIIWRYRSAAARRPRESVRYLAVGRELSNFTYEIANESELLEFVATATGLGLDVVEGLAEELHDDNVLAQHLEERLRSRSDRESRAHFGRRIGWYCIARALKPALIVETGTRDGLGSTVLARALLCNQREGAEGRLLSVDIDPRSGWLIPESLRPLCDLRTGDSKKVLPRVLEGCEVGMMIHDSHHTYEYERFEFDVALQHRANKIALLSDNAHATSALSDLARELGVNYELFIERPEAHFYPGGGIGLAVAGPGDGRHASGRKAS
jgi:hypothetical protein